MKCYFLRPPYEPYVSLHETQFFTLKKSLEFNLFLNARRNCYITRILNPRVLLIIRRVLTLVASCGVGNTV